MRPLWPAAALAIALASLSTTALAAPTKQEWAEWKKLVETAKKAMREGRPGDAVTSLQRADSIHKSPSVDVDLASALAASGKLVEARAIYARVAESKEHGVLWKRARDASKKALAELGPKVPSLRVSVSGAPGASVTVDGNKVETGSDVPIDPGEHTVSASAEGFRAAEKAVSLAIGQHEVVNLDLVASGPASGADGADKPHGSRVPGIVLLSVGGAALAVGGVLGGLAFSAVSSAKEVCKGDVCPPSASDDISRSKTFGNASTGLFIGGGALAVTGIVLTIVAPGGKKAEDGKDKVGVVPVFGPGMVGLAGRF
jgi:hypothetical protein